MKKLLSLFLLAGVLLALAPIYADNEHSTSTSTSTEPIRKEIKAPKNAVTFDPTCVQNAVDKRDNAIIAATQAFSTSTQASLTTRRDALKSAWALTDRTARRTALRAAWKAYNSSLTAIRKTYNNAKRTVWSAWNTDRKACKGTPNDEPAHSSGIDLNL
ncbi:MAG: hypothetical protein C3F02_02520 [Parcubacteria group bacterium]|nr:MAG: hypothetical protein C3F02_02520 [Parcubacteria group bacterium]